MGDKYDFTPAKLDGNAWYHVTEGRVDDKDKKEFTSMFQILKGGSLAVFGNLDNPQYWQFQPLEKEGRYAVRNIRTGVSKQLGVCFNPDEVDHAHTQPCMLRSSGSDDQKWDIASWGDKTFRFINVQNGTDYWMDVHKGNPMFMSDNTNTKVYQAAQHWLMTSASAVNEGAYSTIFSEEVTVSTVTSASTTHTVIADGPSTESSSSSSDSSSGGGGGGLSSGAAAGIGVGAALVVIGLLVGAFLWWRRQKRNRAASTPVEASDGGASGGYVSTPQEKHEYYGGQHQDQYQHQHQQHYQYQAAAQSPPPQEYPQELPHNQAPVEVPGDSHYGVHNSH